MGPKQKSCRYDFLMNCVGRGRQGGFELAAKVGTNMCPQLSLSVLEFYRTSLNQGLFGGQSKPGAATREFRSP